MVRKKNKIKRTIKGYGSAAIFDLAIKLMQISMFFVD
jgi:hypothetical protein